jgi:hypothetical protein
MSRPRHVLALLVPLALGACSRDDFTPTLPDAPEQAGIAALSACVYFDVPPLGATFGGPAGHLPGQGVFSENGIKVGVQRFFWIGGGWAFNLATIVNSPLAGFGAGKVAELNNINLFFDFGNLGWTPTTVKFEWLDLGGFENLKVNGSGVYIGELTAAPTPLGGVGVSHGWFFVPGGKQGSTKLSGLTSIFWVGGQEFYLDNVCAYA